MRLVESGQSIAAAARSLGMVREDAGQLGQGASLRHAERGRQQDHSERGADGKQPSAAELARVTMERDILHPANEGLFAGTPACHPTDINPSAGAPVWEKPWRTSRKDKSEVRID